MIEEPLAGGVGNAGRVVRVGEHVLRPASEQTPTIHALFEHVRANGFVGVPRPVGIDPDGRERLEFIPGDVGIPPFPAWVQTDDALASACRLLRRYHDATVGFVPPTSTSWNRELADPVGGEVIGHNDVCPENVVYRDGEAVALLDFEFAAPARPAFDLAALARMYVPIDTDADAARTGRGGLDPFARLRVAADAYGLPPDRAELVEVLGQQIAGGGSFVQRRVDAGDPAFIAMWEQMGGAERYERRHAWFEDNRQRFLAAVG